VIVRQSTPSQDRHRSRAVESSPPSPTWPGIRLPGLGGNRGPAHSLCALDIAQNYEGLLELLPPEPARSGGAISAEQARRALLDESPAPPSAIPSTTTSTATHNLLCAHSSRALDVHIVHPRHRWGCNRLTARTRRPRFPEGYLSVGGCPSARCTRFREKILPPHRSGQRSITMTQTLDQLLFFHTTRNDRDIPVSP